MIPRRWTRETRENKIRYSLDEAAPADPFWARSPLVDLAVVVLGVVVIRMCV